MELLQSKTTEIGWFIFWSILMVLLSVACRIFRKSQMDVIGKRNLFLVFSAILVAISLWAIFGKGLRFGLDFTGGTFLEFAFKEQVTSSQVRSALALVDQKLENAHIQTEEKNLEQGTYKEGEEPKTFIIVRTEFLSQEQVEKIKITFQEKLGQIELLSNNSIGPTVGGELKRGALIAIAVALIIQLLYITLRFGTNIRYGIAADIALVHDVIIMTGFYALTGREVDSPFVAALLTVIGYSVMDSIVIFDRIRENTHSIQQKVTFTQLVNTSVLQTMTRSVNTLLTVLFTLFALYFFGGETLKNFAFALLVGVTCGAYSSIFVASPVLVIWDQWRSKQQGSQERLNGKTKVSKNGKGRLENEDDKLPESIESTPHNLSSEQTRRTMRSTGSRKPRRDRRKPS